jgi:hypothetical protein
MRAELALSLAALPWLSSGSESPPALAASPPFVYVRASAAGPATDTAFTVIMDGTPGDTLRVRGGAVVRLASARDAVTFIAAPGQRVRVVVTDSGAAAPAPPLEVVGSVVSVRWTPTGSDVRSQAEPPGGPAAPGDTVTVSSTAAGAARVRLVSSPAPWRSGAVELRSAAGRWQGDTLTFPGPGTVYVASQALRVVLQALPGDADLRVEGPFAPYRCVVEGRSVTLVREHPAARLNLEPDRTGRVQCVLLDRR